MLHSREFSAWITIDGKEAVEYDVEMSEDKKTVTCWIASELGKKFSVRWTNKSHYHDIRGRLKTDGTVCGSKILYGHKVPATATHNGVDDGISVKPFKFSSLDLTDDDVFLGGPSYLELGLIELTITPIIITQKDVPPSHHSLSEIKVHERSKKAVTQQITLAEPQFPEKRTKFHNLRTTGPDLVTFCFKYRPIDVLRANVIAPSLKRKASAERPRAQNSDDPEDLAEEAKTLREKLRAVEAKLQKQEKKPVIKDEDGDVIDLTQDSSRSKRVKLERKRPFISGEVVDLT